MWKNISEDGQDPDEFEPPFDELIHWVGAYKDDGEIIGLFFIHPKSHSRAEIHINILEDYRMKYARLAGYMIMQYVIEYTDYQKLEADIPVIYPNVLNFALWNGFTIEGTSRKSIVRDGELINQHILGMTKEEIEQWLIKQSVNF